MKFILIVAVALFSTLGNASSGHGNSGPVLPGDIERVFMACIPSPYDCKHSCPDKKFMVEQDPNVCPIELSLSWACYCLKDKELE